MTKFDRDALFPATAMPDSDWWKVLWPRPEQVLRKVCIKPGMQVVDLCCGDGMFTVPLAKLLDGNVIGVDIDPVMISRAQKAVKRARAPECNWHLGDARSLDTMMDEKVDAVMIANTFHGVPDQPAMVRAVRKVLKPGGLFIVVNWHVLDREETQVLGMARGPLTELRMSPVTLSKLVEQEGFALEMVAELPPFHYGAVFRASV